MSNTPGSGTSDFDAAVAALQSVRARREVRLVPVPAPSRLAPFAHAVSASVGEAEGSARPSVSHEHGTDGDELAAGRFVLLHDPDAPPTWGGAWRVVTYSRARLDPTMGVDPLLGEVGWSWLQESIAGRSAAASALSGTVTRVVDERFGELGGVDATTDLEIRASWSPVDGPDATGAHLMAWTDLLVVLAGLPPLPDGVAALTLRR